MRFPAVLALSFICAYTLGVFAPSYTYLTFGVLGVGFIAYTSLFLLPKRNKIVLRTICLIVAEGIGLAWGAVSAIKKISLDFKNHWGMAEGKITTVEGTLTHDAFRKGAVTLIPLEVQLVEDTKGNRHSAYYPIMVASKTSMRLLKGDKVRIRGSFDPSSLSKYFREKSLVLLYRPLQNRLRNYFLEKAMPEQPEGAIALRDALLLGNKEGLSPSLVLAFQHSGTSHILALSGMHVGILVLLFNFLLKPLLGKKGRGLLIFFLLIFYVFIVGPMPSLVRAVIMYGVYSITVLLKRKVNPLDILSLTFLLSSTLFPVTVLSYSNILSYAAVWGIILLTPKLQLFFRSFLFEPILTALAVSLSAQAFTTPFTLGFFFRLPLFGWLASLFLSPLITFYVWIGIGSLSVPSGTRLGVLLQGSLQFLYTIIVESVESFSRFPSIILR